MCLSPLTEYQICLSGHHCFKILNICIWGHAVVQLVEALRYKPEGRGFDTGWCQWNFTLTWSFRPYNDTGVKSVSNRNKYQEYFVRGKGDRCVELTILPLSCTNCLQILVSQLLGTVRKCPGLQKDCFIFTNRGNLPFERQPRLYLFIEVKQKAYRHVHSSLVLPKIFKDIIVIVIIYKNFSCDNLLNNSLSIFFCCCTCLYIC